MERAVSPLRYPGGKSLIYPFLESFLEENEMIGGTYAEPFAGGAGLALALLYKGLVKKIYINDLDKAIYSFWKYALENSEEMCKWVAKVPLTVSSWKKFHNAYLNSTNLSTEDLAKATFFLNRTNVSGVIKGGLIGGLGQTGAYKIDARFNRKSLIKKIQRLGEYKENIILSNEDALTFIKKRERMQSDIFLYLDPPYYQKAPNLYMNFYRGDDHANLAKFVQTMKKNWMVSYDNHAFIQNLYSDRNSILYSLQQSASNRIGKEILIFKDNLVFAESMKKLKNAIILQ